MKRLDEILSKSRNAASSALPSEPSPQAADADPCPLCGGAGFVRRDRPLDHPRFGKAEPCDCVLDEADDVRRSRLERLSNLGSLTRFAFDTLLPGGRDQESPWFQAAVAAAQAFAAQPAGWLVISGPSGSGKTHLAAAIANARVALGAPALFMVVPDLLDHLRASFDAGAEDLGYDQLFEHVRNAPLLLLDDLDAASSTPWVREKLFQIVNHRYNAALPTVFTCTARPRDLDDRLATRLCDEALATILALAPQRKGGYRQVGGLARERLAESQFRDFDVRGAGLRPDERDSLDAAFRTALAYAGDPQGWLILQGSNGCGKTHLACAVANRVLAGGGDVFFAVVPDLLDHLRASFAPGSDVGYDELFDDVRNAGLLVLDDLGAQATSPWAEEKLYQIVNYRTVAGLPTVVTTDRTLDELSAAHPRIVARIVDPRAGTLVAIDAPHYRLGRVLATVASQPKTPRRRG
ncbi:MAG: ATP-binding protein [Dehalococcoidia bacterium]|nr:ATP-binding protein [Dehalococcoidia bacterium]